MFAKRATRFGRWFTVMVDTAPSHLTTATPVLLLIINQGLTALGGVHVTVGWQVQALAYALLGGNVVRRGLESGRIVAALTRARAEYEAAQHPVVPAERFAFAADPVPALVLDGPPPGLPTIDAGGAAILAGHRDDLSPEQAAALLRAVAEAERRAKGVPNGY